MPEHGGGYGAGLPEDPPVRVQALLAGVAVRPFAQSAVRAGALTLAVDHFGDRDHRSDVIVVSLRRDVGLEEYSARTLVQVALRLRALDVAYGADLENHPRLVARLAGIAEGRLLGNPPLVLRRARNPFAVSAALRDAGLPAPEVRPPDDPPSGDDGRRWLRKPLRGGGGHGVRPWRPGEPPGEEAYLQERIDGAPAALLFVADGRRARLLAVTSMLVGRPEFGASGHLFCGSLLRLGPDGRPVAPAAGPSGDVLERARDVVRALVRDLGLRGLNGVDVILRDGRPWPVEVNPRWTSSMELLEIGSPVGGRRLPRALYALHRSASAGELPPEEALPGGGPAGGDRPVREVRGKALLRARRPGRAPDLTDVEGISAGSAARRAPSEAPGGIAVADVPEPGDRLPPGGPVCTLLASAADAEACLERLDRGAARVYRRIEGDG
jgi:predicted ATP-grasp superfamily ATP-dependent carboligase